MYRACIAAIDATVARIFVFERTSDGTLIHESFVEQPKLPAGARRLHQHLGDHERHVEQLDASFAREIVERLAHESRAPIQRLIVCATSHMLGDLRRAGIPHREGLIVDEIPRDLVQLTASELREQIADYGLIPPRATPPMGAIRASSSR